MDIFFATNRRETPRADEPFGERFHKDGPAFYRVGRAVVDKVSDDEDEGYEVRGISVAEERKPDVETRRGGRMGSSAIFAELRERMVADQRDILIYIHGFANTFSNALERAAQIKQAYLVTPEGGGEPYEPHMFAFAWPSNGRVQPPWEYFSDRQDAAASGLAMARGLMRLRDFLAEAEAPCNQRIHLVAHSMGNWALRHAVLGLRELAGANRLPKFFDNVFLMAADEDEDTFEHDRKLGLLPQMARAVHVYHSAGDKALTVSDTTKNNPDRLGTDGPRTFSGLSARISAVDCHKTDWTKLAHANHQYYRLRPEVIADVRAVLAGSFRPDEIPNRVVVESGRRYRIKGD